MYAIGTTSVSPRYHSLLSAASSVSSMLWSTIGATAFSTGRIWRMRRYAPASISGSRTNRSFAFAEIWLDILDCVFLAASVVCIAAFEACHIPFNSRRRHRATRPIASLFRSMSRRAAVYRKGTAYYTKKFAVRVRLRLWTSYTSVPLFHFRRGHYSIFADHYSILEGIRLLFHFHHSIFACKWNNAFSRQSRKVRQAPENIGQDAHRPRIPLFHFVQNWTNRLRQYTRRGEASSFARCYGGQADLKSGAK